MNDLVALHNRLRVISAVAKLPLNPPPEQIHQAVDALRNTLTTGTPHDDGERGGGYVFPALDL